MVDFDGSLWDIEGPVASTASGPQSGFNNPSDLGTIELLSADSAEYRNSKGKTLRLSRHNGAKVFRLWA